MYTTSIPTLFITIQSCSRFRPTPEKESPAKPEYELVLAALLNRRTISTDFSVSIPANTIMIRPGIAPSCLRVAGRAMIPAPTMVVERLNTAPVYDAPPNSPPPWSLGISGADLWPRRYFRSENGISEIPRERERLKSDFWRAERTCRPPGKMYLFDCVAEDFTRELNRS